VAKAREGIKDLEQEADDVDAASETPLGKRQQDLNNEALGAREPAPQAVPKPKEDLDANAGSDYDASDLPLADPGPLPIEQEQKLTIPNSVFLQARILVNPRCVTTYAGVSHTQLALDLFGPPDSREDRDDEASRKKDVLEDWEGAPDNFVCQEQQTTGGRRAPKNQRRLSFSIHQELEEAAAAAKP